MNGLDRKLRWDEIKSIFAEAVELPADDRRGFIERRCGGDKELIDEMNSLLEAHFSDGHLIEDNALDLAAALVEDEPNYSARRFGNYKIIREIGSGGMGSVFLAERTDGEFSMNVALKVVRQSIADSATIARFKQERQILANLHHPNIAVLLDGGIGENGEPFIAMEFVEGLSLTEYCDANNVSIDGRLRLFLKVCAAVSYAHRNLVIHRDIKPSNIIVTNDGEPKLLDFGMAKAFEDDASVTQTAFRAFTPAYASPEQILGKPVTTASDQYSLGVVLYELLAGKMPFDNEGKSIDEIIRSAGTTEPPPPSTSVRPRSGDNAALIGSPKVSSDLDTITLKSLRAEPERRYASVDSMAEDIERYLAGRPISARPNTFTYIASRFVRRNIAAAAAALIVILAVTAGLAASLWQGSIARRERDRAEKRFNEVRQLSNSLLFEIAPKLETLPGSVEARELLVLKALDYLDGLAAEARDDTELNIELARAYEMVGDLQGNPGRPNIGDFAGAIESYQKALSIFEFNAETAEGRERLAQILLRLAKTKFAQGQIEDSIGNAEQAAAILSELVAESGDPSMKLKFLAAEIEKAQSYGINNQYDVAIPIYNNVLASLDPYVRNDPEILRISIIATAYLGNSLSWNGSQIEAEAANERAVAMADDLLEANVDDPRILTTAFIAYTQASSTYETIKNDLSLKYAKKALEIAKRSADADPADGQAKHNLAKALSRYGVVLVLVKRLNEGFEHLRQAQQALEQLIAREPRNLVYRDDLGTLHTRLGDAEKNRRVLTAALREYKRSAEIFQKMAEEDELNLVARRDWAQALKSVAVTEIKINRIDDAKSNLNKAIELVEALKAKNAIGKWDVKIFDQMYKIRDDLDK